MKRRGLIYVLLLALVASALAAGAAMVYANRVARAAEARANAESAESDRRWCTVLGRLTGTYNDPASPPQTELGRQIAEDFRVLLASLGCPPA